MQHTHDAERLSAGKKIFYDLKYITEWMFLKNL